MVAATMAVGPGGKPKIELMRLLVVEDNEVIASAVRRGLKHAGYEVDIAADGDEGLELGLTAEYSVIILDLMLPGRDGLSVCEALRRQRVTTPVIMLTALDALDDRVRGLETGADDYLPKPFEFAELLARVRALLRRDKVHKLPRIQIADLEIDTTARVVRRAGREIPLTNREFTLLEALAANEGRVLTRQAIQERVWGDFESLSDTVRAYITLLRKKIDADHPDKLIRTVHGVGYVLRRPEGQP
ncbi:MAG TPA: response regulator transcription factor [Armatimonadota bacterium]|jgi:two-component system copper resistance phosphate regulon response regulator CusR